MDILELFNVDKECLIDSIITKQMVYEAGDLNIKEKEIFTSEVRKIVWEASLKEENTGFKAYRDENIEYDEVEIIRVVLKEKKQYKKIANILQKLMPYPIVLIFEYDKEFLINLAFKRINKNDDEKNTLDEMEFSAWFFAENQPEVAENEKIFLKSLNIKNILVNNFYMLYKNLEKSLLIYNTSIATGINRSFTEKSAEELKKLQSDLDFLNSAIRKLEIKRDKEKQLNKRIEYQMKIKKSNIKREKLLKELNN